MSIRQLPDPAYSTKEAAHVLGISQDTVLSMIHDGRLRGFRAGSKLFRVQAVDLEAYIERQALIAAP